MLIYSSEGDLHIQNIPDLDLEQTLDCGQAFRWEQPSPGVFEGVAGGRLLRISQSGQELVLHGTTEAEFEAFWRGYFDLDRDYGAIKELLRQDAVFAKALDFAPGIRILCQEPWEALCSFIISQNNNIPRIKGIIQRLCECFGEEVAPGAFSFPSAQRIAALSAEELAPLRCGFRTRYILDAARKVATGEVDFPAIASMSAEEAEQELCKIVGVGSKVARCALLFGFAKVECIPLDVWIKRCMAQLFPQGLPEYAVPYAGIAQQYLFHYVRLTPDALPGEPAQAI